MIAKFGLLNCLTLFFNHLVESNNIPSLLNVSIIKPILKDNKKDSNDINNIRPISISNCFAQILEKLIILSSPQMLKTHKNQFGFKKHTSCNHAIFVLKETISRYLDGGSSLTIANNN